MLITQPPLERLGLYVDTYDCSQTSHLNRSGSYIIVQNARGVTLGDIVDYIWRTRLPRNIGAQPPMHNRSSFAEEKQLFPLRTFTQKLAVINTFSALSNV
jgi:hypothetical protein